MDEHSVQHTLNPPGAATDETVIIPPTDAPEKKTSHRHNVFSHRRSLLPVLLIAVIMIGGLGAGLMFMEKTQDTRS